MVETAIDTFHSIGIKDIVVVTGKNQRNWNLILHIQEQYACIQIMFINEMFDSPA
jgi:dTDP-glucose pyrophosphorylase